MRKAFTLAEVLITLGIIGVVAALTMPVLIAKYQKDQTIARLKKAYSEISQALKMAEAEYGTMDSWDFLDFPDAVQRAEYFGDNYLLKYIKTAEKCYPAASQCWKQPLNIKKESIGTYLTTDNPLASRMAFLTASGYSGYFWAHATGAGGWIYIDIDGPKKGPAILGKDVFAFQFCNGQGCKAGFHAKGLEAFDMPTREELFAGVGDAAYGCGKAATKYAGMECAAVIIMDGWQIKNDYPW